MSDLSLFVMETDLSELPDGQLSRMEEILLRSQKSALTEIDEINSALIAINDVRRRRGGDDKKTAKSPKKQ
ncbi:MAG: hypothetical protein AAF899_07980 [Pseudomonadota bacterium]